MFPPKVAAEWLVLLLRIWEVSGSNLRPETSYCDIIRGFYQTLRADAGILL
jgi:hypothetical protein